MDEKRTTEQPQEERPAKKRGLRRFLTFLAILLAVLGVVVVAAYRDGTGFDALRRLFSYGTAEKEGGTVGFTYDASTENRFAVLGDGLAVLSGTELQVLDGEGGQVYTAAVKMASPALSTAGELAVAYDVGGTELHVVDKTGEKYSLTADEDEPFIAATLNEKGYLAVTAEKRNYKSCVSVYDTGGKLVFAFNSSERFVTDACVSADGKSLAAVTLGQKDSVFVSNIVLYDLSATEPRANYDVEDGLVLTIGAMGDLLATLSDTSLTLAESSGKITACYGFGGEYLREYSLDGDGFTALLLNRYRSGSVGRLVTVGPDGTELGALQVDGEVRSISAAGRYLAVLYADSLVIYNPELQEYATLSGADAARSVLMRADGSALLLSSEQASLFLP